MGKKSGENGGNGEKMAEIWRKGGNVEKSGEKWEKMGENGILRGDMGVILSESGEKWGEIGKIL